MSYLRIWAAVGLLVTSTAALDAPRPQGFGLEVGSVVVNEIAPGSYIELHNASMSTVDIGRFELWLCDTNGMAGTIRISSGQELAPGAFYLIASSSYSGAAADQQYGGVLPGGGAALHDSNHDWADGVATVAGSLCGEGDPAPECPSAATGRDAAGTDSGHNAVDFSCRCRSPREPN